MKRHIHDAQREIRFTENSFFRTFSWMTFLIFFFSLALICAGPDLRPATNVETRSTPRFRPSSSSSELVPLIHPRLGLSQ